MTSEKARLKFDPQSLYDAVDARRRELGMSWTDLSRELHVSTSTIKGMTKRKWGIELDGVIGMTRWVGRTVESFAGGDGGPSFEPTSFAQSRRFLRFHTAGLYAAVNEERQRRELTWDQVAAEVWPSGPWGARQLKSMAKGGRSDVYKAIAICGWMGRTIQSFLHETIF